MSPISLCLLFLNTAVNLAHCVNLVNLCQHIYLITEFNDNINIYFPCNGYNQYCNIDNTYTVYIVFSEIFV